MEDECEALLSEKKFQDSNRTVIEKEDKQMVIDEVKTTTVRVYQK